MDNGALLKMLKNQVVPALGCTEPVAVAIAVSTAFQQVKGTACHVSVTTSLNIFKNGMRVGIPGTREKGIQFASALAIICGNPALQLEVFRDVTPEHEKRARDLLQRGVVHVAAASGSNEFYINAVVETDLGAGECTIQGGHTNIVEIRKNRHIVFKADKEEPNGGAGSSYADLFLDDILRFAETADKDELAFLLEGVRMNLEISQVGRQRAYCSGLGWKLHTLIRQGKLSDDLPNRIRAAAAAACDARMAGLKKPVMSSAGSGNHGITAILPIALMAQEYGKTDEELCRALAVSHLTTALIKQRTGKLSPICGCAVAAGSGAAAGTAWLMGVREEKAVEDAINNMIGCLSGMLCDGAKGSCSFKVATAATEAYYQSLMALEGVSTSPGDGLIGETSLQSVENIAEISRTAMNGVDACLVRILARG